MTSSNWIRWGGLVGVAAGTMYALTAILSLFAPQEAVFDSISDYLIEVIFVVGLAGTLIVVASQHALQKDSYGRLGAGGSLITFTGYALLLVAAAATTLAGREVLDTVFPVGVLAILLGSILLGIMTLRARLLPWWCGVFLIVGFPLTVPLDLAVRGAGGIMLGIVWALLGYALLQRRDARVHQPARVNGRTITGHGIKLLLRPLEFRFEQAPTASSNGEVLDLIARGLRNPEIAEHLYLSPKTVRNHISNIFAKLQVADRAQAIVRARQAGLG